MPEAVSQGDLIARAARASVLAALGAYRRWISPLLPPACRFHPTCSEYAAQAIETQGLLRGGTRALLRILRCQPLARGGYDPVR